MPQVKCKICSREFYTKPNWIKKGMGSIVPENASMPGAGMEDL